MTFYSSQVDKRAMQIGMAQHVANGSVGEMPPVGTTPPQTLAQEAAVGHRGAAWRLIHRIMENDPQTIQAVAAFDDERLIRNFVEYIALGTWAGKAFTVPVYLRTPYARTRLRTLFSAARGSNRILSERVLLEELHEQRPQLRETAIYLFGIMGSSAAVHELINALHDHSPSIRMQAAKALGRSGSPEAVPALLEALHGADEQQGSQIFQALVHLGPIAVPALLHSSQSHSDWMRWHSIRALCEIRDKRALPTVVNALRDPDHSVAWMAAKGLVPFGKDSVRPVLQLLVNTEMTSWLAETASYVLHEQMKNHAKLKADLEPVVQQMHTSTYHTGTCYTALKALEILQAKGLIK